MEEKLLHIYQNTVFVYCMMHTQKNSQPTPYEPTIKILVTSVTINMPTQLRKIARGYIPE